MSDSPISTIQGYAAGLLASLFLSLSAAFVQLLGGFIPSFELNLARFGAQFIVCLVIILIQQRGFRIGFHLVGWVTFNTFGLIADNILYYTATSRIPLGNQSVVYYASSIVSSALVSTFILKDRVLPVDCPLILMVLIGGVLICQSDPPFEHLNKGLCIGMSDVNLTTAADPLPCDERKTMAFRTGMESTIGYILTVIAGVIATASICTVRSKLQDISPIIICFWHGAGGSVASIALMAYFEEPVYIINVTQAIFLIGHCIGVTVCSLSLVAASQLLTPVATSLISSTTLVFGFILQYCFPGIFLTGNRNAAEVVGAVLVASGAILSTLLNVRVKQVKQSD